LRPAVSFPTEARYDGGRMPQSLDAFITKWVASGAAERANKDSFSSELCDVLGVARPNPTVGDPERDTYVFERKVPLVHADCDATLGSIDLYKQDCFVLEAAYETRNTRRWKPTRSGA